MYKNIKVDNQNNEGNGIARINNKIVFIPFALKNDIVDIDIIKENKNYNYGLLKNINISSEERRGAKCPYYYQCGGCNLMHQKYEYQLLFKKNKVINNLKHITNLNIENIDITYDDEYYYRNHIRLSVNKNKIGFLKNNSNDIVDIEKCIISNDIINKKIEEIRSFLNAYKDNNINKIDIKAYEDILINIESNNFKLIKEFNNCVKCNSLFLNNKLVSGKERCNINFNGYKFEISSKSFFQKNTTMAIKLYDYIKSNIDKDSNVLDLYCGIGSIGIYISDKCKNVIGIEIIDEAVKDAFINAKINNRNNIKFISGKVEDNIDKIDKIDSIIVDPPRIGLNKKVISSILNIKPNKIIYVSCNSTTLSRDLNYLKEYYDIDSIKLFDLFPNTFHVESVAILKEKL